MLIFRTSQVQLRGHWHEDPGPKRRFVKEDMNYWSKKNRRETPFFLGGGPGVLVLAWDCGFLLLLLSYYSFLNFQTFFCWNCTTKALGDEQRGDCLVHVTLLLRCWSHQAMKSLNKSRLVEPRTVGLRRRELPWSRAYCTRKKWLDFTLFPFYHTSQVYFLFILFHFISHRVL